jgi:hypothetical protein
VYEFDDLEWPCVRDVLTLERSQVAGRRGSTGCEWMMWWGPVERLGLRREREREQDGDALLYRSGTGTGTTGAWLKSDSMDVRKKVEKKSRTIESMSRCQCRCGPPVWWCQW